MFGFLWTRKKYHDIMSVNEKSMFAYSASGNQKITFYDVMYFGILFLICSERFSIFVWCEKLN